MAIFKNLFNRDKKQVEKNKEQERAGKAIVEENMEESIEETVIEEDKGQKEEETEIIEEDKEHKEEMVEEKVSQPKKSFFSKLVKGLTKTRSNIMDGIDQVLKSFKKIDEELYEELEEALIMADIGVSTTMNIMENLRKRVKEEKITEAIELRQLLIEEISKLLEKGNHEVNIEEGPVVILVIGVNGVGKTTTIGKLAHNFKKQKKKVLLAAADTFRAAAIEQLEVWGDRVGVDVIRHQENSDPAAVIFDAIQAAKSRKIDVLICDTAGRLHNKKNLMEELKKIFRIITREYPEAKKEVFLVLDATTGQNALQQVKLFKEVADISGIVLTKLDGTAKGGIIVGISSEMNIPVKYIGVGEGIDDLQPFNPKEFATALFANYDD
nr:signal recognition particle-docking protein FtsY [Defluviitalea phaphyphila]